MVPDGPLAKGTPFIGAWIGGSIAPPTRVQQERVCRFNRPPQGLARPERFELPTPRSVVWCSIQLSYGRKARREASGIGAPTQGGRLRRAPREIGLSLEKSLRNIARQASIDV